MGRVAVYVVALAFAALIVLVAKPPTWACFLIGWPIGVFSYCAGEIAQEWWDKRRMWP